MKQVADQQWVTALRLSTVLSLLFAIALLSSNTYTYAAVFSSWVPYAAAQEDGAVLKENPDKPISFCFFQTEEVEEKESEDNTSAGYTDGYRPIFRSRICSNPVLSLYDSALLSSPPLKRYLLFHALKLDC